MSLGSVNDISLVVNIAGFVEPLRALFEIVPSAPAVRDGNVFGMRHVIVERVGTGLCPGYSVVRGDVGDYVPMLGNEG